MRSIAVASGTLLFLSPIVSAQWLPSSDYAIQRVGLTSSDYTSPSGVQRSAFRLRSASGMIYGYSERYAAVGTNASRGRDLWVFDGIQTRSIGLVGNEYTRPDGYRYMDMWVAAPNGPFVGISNRYDASGADNGKDAWVWNGSNSVLLGLTGSGHTAASGRRQTTPLAINNTLGQVAGTTSVYDASGAIRGQDAWLFDGVSTRRIGPTGGSYVAPDGYGWGETVAIYSSGSVLGWSARYAGEQSGISTWLWSPTGATVEIGLTDPAHADINGLSINRPAFGSGAAAFGTSRQRGAGGWSGGQDSWISTDGITTQIGLVGPEYTDPSGKRFSEPMLPTRTGQAMGYSWRYDATGAENGTDAWVGDADATRRIGLVGGVHTGSAGYQSTHPMLRNSAGVVVGTSSRISGERGSLGSDTWYFDGEETRQIGLTGGAYTSASGEQRGDVKHLSAAGRVTGSSMRYNAAGLEYGRDAWTSDGTITRQVGLTGGAYTGAAGYRDSYPHLLAPSGLVAGYSMRIAGERSENGYSAWYYDPATNITSEILGVVRPTNGYAYSLPVAFLDDGVLLGYYTHYTLSAQGGVLALEDRAFLFRPDLGMTDLGALVDGGLAASDWRRLEYPGSLSRLDSFVGSGRMIGQPADSNALFVMTIPTPQTFPALAVIGLFVAGRRR